MLVYETFKNELDGKELLKLTSDSGFYILEIATQVEYAEAIIPLSRSIEEFEETEKIIGGEL